MEKEDSVDQKRRSVLRFLADHAAVFSRQGSVQTSWRWHKGKRLGPFFRLSYRDGPRQCCLYLGADGALAEEVRRALRELQAPLREGRERERLAAQAWAAYREVRRAFDRELRAAGLFLKGNQVRGWRALRGAPRAGPA